MSPYARQLLREVEVMLANFPEVGFVCEVDAEEAGVVVGPPCSVSIFSASVVTEWAFDLSEAFEEFLQVAFYKAPPLGEFFVVVSECDEAVIIVELCFVDAAHRPLPAAF